MLSVPTTQESLVFVDRFAPYAVNILRIHFREDLPWAATELLKDGEKIGNVRLEAENGRTVVLYEFDTVRADFEFRSHLSRLSPTFLDEMPADEESFMGLFFIGLVDAWHLHTTLTKMCEHHTCFRLTGDVADTWRVADKPYSPSVADELKDMYGNGLEAVANAMLVAVEQQSTEVASHRHRRSRRKLAAVSANSRKTIEFSSAEESPAQVECMA